jgi:hypothetical protein
MPQIIIVLFKFYYMKRVTILVLFMIIGIAAVSAQNAKPKTNPIGTWKFEAPYAPEGYTSGTIVLGKEDKKDLATMSFTGSEEKMPGENVKIGKDSTTFSIYMQGEDISVVLKPETEAKMTGKAVYSQGEVPLTLTKDASPAK